MAKQTGFWSIEDRLEELSTGGDPTGLEADQHPIGQRRH